MVRKLQRLRAALCCKLACMQFEELCGLQICTRISDWLQHGRAALAAAARAAAAASQHSLPDPISNASARAYMQNLFEGGRRC